MCIALTLVHVFFVNLETFLITSWSFRMLLITVLKLNIFKINSLFFLFSLYLFPFFIYPTNILILAQWEFLISRLRYNKFLLFKATKFIVICYSSNRKLIQKMKGNLLEGMKAIYLQDTKLNIFQFWTTILKKMKYSPTPNWKVS